MEALIYKIDRMNTHNGPGFRTVIYFKGCPLHCTWCHNPEGINFKPEVWFSATKCIGCGACVENCPEKALRLDEKVIHIDREKCTGCQHCVSVCPTKAMEPIGKKYEIEDLMKTLKQDMMLFESSGGGVTVTGGEPGVQAEFVAALFRECKANGIHTAFDTSGVISLKSLCKVLPYTDLLFLDIKILDEQKSQHYTGLSLVNLQNTIQELNAFKKEHPDFEIEIRTPLVPGVNDDDKGLVAIGEFIKSSFDQTPSWELCMFNDLCEDKYNRMGMQWPFKNKKHNRADYFRFQNLHDNLPIAINISGFIEKGNQ